MIWIYIEAMIWWHCLFFIDVNAGFKPMDGHGKHTTCVIVEEQLTDVVHDWQAPFDHGPLRTALMPWGTRCLWHRDDPFVASEDFYSSRLLGVIICPYNIWWMMLWLLLRLLPFHLLRNLPERSSFLVHTRECNFPTILNSAVKHIFRSMTVWEHRTLMFLLPWW